MSLEHIKEITTKTADTIPMLDHCVVTDNTGTIRLTLWGSTIKEITNNNSYMITNLRVKSFDAKKYLTTTPTTTIQAIDETFPPPTEEYFDSFFKLTTIYVDKITWLKTSKPGFPAPNAHDNYQNSHPHKNMLLSAQTVKQRNHSLHAQWPPLCGSLLNKRKINNLFG